MAETKTIKEKTVELIDALKATCQTYGMGNDGNEYKIITQVFLYKFLNDKFGYEVKKMTDLIFLILYHRIFHVYIRNIWLQIFGISRQRAILT